MNTYLNEEKNPMCLSAFSSNKANITATHKTWWYKHTFYEAKMLISASNCVDLSHKLIITYLLIKQIA